MKEDGYEEEMGLVDLQDYIEAENRRLDAENGFWAKEIVIKIEYKYWCGRRAQNSSPSLFDFPASPSQGVCSTVPSRGC